MEATTGYILEGGRLFAATGPEVIDDGAVVVTGQRVSWAGPRGAVPEEFRRPEYAVVDTAGRTMMPGLIDGHMHISFGEAEAEEELSLYTSAEYRAIRAAWDAKKVLDAGVTSACDPGGPYRVATAVRDAITAGMVEGPRLSAAGKQITTHQGIADGFPSWIQFPESSFGALVRNPYEILEEIRREIKDGVDIIKLAGSGPQSDESAAFRLDEVALAVDETHRLERKITIHARSRQACEYAAKAGVDWIMHASYMDEPTLEIVLEKHIPILPALTLLVNILEAGAQKLSPAARDGIQREIDAAARILSRARECGATFLYGSETGFSMTPYGEWHARELEIYVTHFGMKPIEALLCATRNAATAVPRYRHEIGTLEAGKYADLLVVDGRPDQDVRVLQEPERIQLVMQAGHIVDRAVGRRERQVWRFEKAHTYPPLYRRADRVARGVDAPREAVHA